MTRLGRPREGVSGRRSLIAVIVACPALLMPAVFLARGPSLPAPVAPLPTIAALAATPAVALALKHADATENDLVAEWIRLASVPSSSGQEGARADLVEKALREGGLEGVTRDGAGNVIGVLRGRDLSAKKSVFMAHMDTVAKPGADFTMRREGDRLRGPGIRDDSSGLAGLVAAARLAREAGIVPPVDVMIVASVGEE